jgi:hypothetical protein
MSPCFRSTLTHSLLKELNSETPTLLKFPQKGNFREVCVQNWQSHLNSVFAVNERISGFWRHQLRVDTKVLPKISKLLRIVASIVYASMVSQYCSVNYFQTNVRLLKDPSFSLGIWIGRWLIKLVHAFCDNIGTHHSFLLSSSESSWKLPNGLEASTHIPQAFVS